MAVMAVGVLLLKIDYSCSNQKGTGLFLLRPERVSTRMCKFVLVKVKSEWQLWQLQQ